MSRSEAPVLDGYVTADGVCVVVWCKYCRKLHTHGHVVVNGAIGEGDGHRSPHCHNRESGYDRTGYVIREVARFKSDAEEKRYAREQLRAQRG